jgi:hypothetical protein
MQTKFLENTAELIKSYASKAFGMEGGEDEIWLIGSDRMKNYRHYFNSDNSCNLEQKFNVSTRVKSIQDNEATEI